MNEYPNTGWQSPPAPNPPKSFFAGKTELIFLALMALSGISICNFTLYAGFDLGFALAVPLCIWSSFGYLLCKGHRPTAYSAALLVLSTVCALGFARSDDGFVKFVLVCFLTAGSNLGLCLQAGQNRRDPGVVSSLLDACKALFFHGLGSLSPAVRGLSKAVRANSTAKKGGAFLLGLCISVPALLMIIPLLISADAAFSGLVELLPKFRFFEFAVTAVMGTVLTGILYARSVSLHHQDRVAPAQPVRKGVNAITVNTALSTVCLVYVAYLVSQLAYFAGGFAGILPEEYTLAQYARRGFGEMAVLTGINLALICLSLGIMKKENRAPLSTRILCLFIGFVTLFFVAAASAKMFLYIESYGLTRLRVMTQIIMLFFALTTAIVMVWLFLPKLPYMKAVLLLALVMGAATLWMDVDTLVAGYNVNAYLTGKLQTVDLTYLSTLSDGAVPHIAKLQQDETYATAARNRLKERKQRQTSGADLRSWNYVNHAAKQHLPE